MSHPIRATVSHFELPAASSARAARFYRRVFGWRVERLAAGGNDYYTIRTDAPDQVPPGAHVGAIGGGLGAPAVIGAEQPLLVLHLHGCTLTECLLAISRAGGEIVEPPRQVGKMGFFARFRDPEGNLLGLWSDGG
ncbi:MAG TPA: VOC family protein [Thermoanaerobaculia bacterium]|nr:VOC family protein [Thermoanaerobaculia bacterium]